MKREVFLWGVDAVVIEEGDGRSFGEADLHIVWEKAGCASKNAKGIQIFYPKAQYQGGQAQRLNASGVSTRRAAIEHETKSKDFATAVQRSLEASQISESETPRSVPLRILQDTKIPGFLIEVGFLSNPAEEALLSTEAYRRNIAAAIAEGIREAALPKTTQINFP